MPLTKEEIVERCDHLIERYKDLPTPSDITVVSLVAYISLSSAFKDITSEEAIDLIQIYLEKLKAIA